MKRYEYRCDICLWVWETIRTIDDDSDEECPDCNCYKTSKVISPLSFILKEKDFLNYGD